jgi:hypothetical protein
MRVNWHEGGAYIRGNFCWILIWVEQRFSAALKAVVKCGFSW